jgi:hypothetical protein
MGVVCEVVIGSLQPNQPGVLQVVEDVCVVFVVVEVTVFVELVVVVVVAVTSSLQPNQPGVLHVDVEVVVTGLLVVVTPDVVVVSSRQPHHPGVWQVEVRVLGFVEVDDKEVVVSLLFPVTSFHRGQS